MSSAEHSGSGDEQDQFDAIVARLREEGWPDLDAGDDVPDPAAERSGDEEPGNEKPSDESDAGADSASQEEATPPPADPVAGLPSQWRVPSGDSLSILDEKEFVPEEPRPLPSGDLGFWGAIAGLGGGIVWLLYLFFFDRYARPLWWVLAVVVTLTGLVLVFLRQPHQRDDDWDDHVDGAVL